MAAIAAAAAVGAGNLPARAAPPPSCNNAVQITDASGDGHHAPTDVLQAWFSESSGRLQVVVRVRAATPMGEHDDAETRVGGYAVIYTVDGVTRYVRARLPVNAADPATYDTGTYAGGFGFASTGATTGTVETGAVNGTVTIDVPGLSAGAKVVDPYVLTYDGVSGGAPTWVDRAPGGTGPDERSFGAEYVVGCPAPPAGSTPTTPGSTPAGPAAGPLVLSGVTLNAPKRRTGGGTVTVTGRIAPGVANVPVTITRRGKTTATTRTVTKAGGTYAARVPIGETTVLRAQAGGLTSQSVTTTVTSRVRIEVRRAKAGGYVVTGTVTPKLPGRVLWLRTTSVEPSARTTVQRGTFRLRLKHPRAGRYQAVVIPTGGRAERATSNTGVLR